LSEPSDTMDLNNPSIGGINLPADGSWVTTSNLCFTLQDTLFNDPTTCLEIVWARDGHTNAYATSFVEVAEWVEADSTQMANGNIYDGLESTDGDASCFTEVCKVVGDYGIRLTFDTLDCINKTACFNVQLRTEDSNGWGLAGQNYRIYYDAALASWQSGTSTLGTAYQGFQLIQDIQDVDASATNSNLSFEDTLGFLNYTMDLNDPSIGGTNLPADGSWLTTSQLCFTLEDALLDNSSTCLEAIWARDTLTAKYATSFVEVSEWIEPNSTQMANGVYYDDLEASDGNDACFVNSCLYDYGDLQDNSNMTSANDYQTQQVNNGPAHLIIAGLSLGSTVDDELDGQSSIDALEDGMDEDGLIIFSTLNVSPGATIKLPFSYTNLTGHTAHLEAWLDWNGDGDFDPINELIGDWDDAITAFPTIMPIYIPTAAQTNTQLGLRIRLSLQDDMTPYGIIGSGEIEDYLIGISCKQVCLPFTTEIKK